MATKIVRISNAANAPVAYVGKDGTNLQTGWAAWGFRPVGGPQDFGWFVTTVKKDQALLTPAGEYYIWDDDYVILYEQVGTADFKKLVVLDRTRPFEITVSVDDYGRPSGRQS